MISIMNSFTDVLPTQLVKFFLMQVIGAHNFQRQLDNIFLNLALLQLFSNAFCILRYVSFNLFPQSMHKTLCLN